MAEDKVKKGFFFYFSLFLIAIVAALLVIFVVMMFMPGKSILGLQYFTNNSTIKVETTTDPGATKINFLSSNFSEIEISAGYSQVIIQNNNEFEENGIYLVNTSCGFVKSADAKNFEYSVKIEDDVLKIDVIEQPGFIYFSKNSKIILHLSNSALTPFSNKTITIKTVDGNVNIGGDTITGYSRDIEILNLNVETNSGGIMLSSHSPSAYNNLSLKTNSGDITSSRADIDTQTCSLETASGGISLGSISSVSNLTLNSESGRLNIGEISANVSSNFKNAYATIGEIYGSWDFSNSTDMDSSVIKTNIIRGALTVPNGKNSNFEIGSVVGSANITTTSGDVSIFSNSSTGKNMTSGISANSSIKTSSGKIEVVVADGANGNISLETQDGEINAFATSNFSKILLQNKNGKININLPKSTSVKIEFSLYQNVEGNFSFDKVNFNRDDVNLENITIVNGGENSLQIESNSTVNFAWD